MSDIKLFVFQGNSVTELGGHAAALEKDPQRQIEHLKLSGETTADGFTRDVSNIGHWGTGDLEVNVRTADDLDKAKALILKSYEKS